MQKLHKRPSIGFDRTRSEPCVKSDNSTSPSLPNKVDSDNESECAEKRVLIVLGMICDVVEVMGHDTRRDQWKMGHRKHR